jgi:hypothetical protein
MNNFMTSQSKSLEPGRISKAMTCEYLRKLGALGPFHFFRIVWNFGLFVFCTIDNRLGYRKEFDQFRLHDKNFSSHLNDSFLPLKIPILPLNKIFGTHFSKFF